jgi:non-heme chloroperoxidase
MLKQVSVALCLTMWFGGCKKDDKQKKAKEREDMATKQPVEKPTMADAAPAAPAKVEPTVKKAKLKKDIELEYAELGAAGGTPVLMIHGVFDSRHAFDLMLPHVPPTWHVYIPDLRGHGNSTKPDKGYAQADLVGDLVAFLDSVGEKKVHVVGHSMGALIAHKLAIEHPDRVDRLVLVAATPTMKGKPGPAEGQKMFATFKDPVDPGFVGEFVKSSFVKPVPDDFMQAQVAETSKIPAKVWNQVFAGAIAEDHSKKLGSIKAKTLILWGDKDVLFDAADQKVLDEQIPDSTLKTYAGVGHNIPSENAEEAAKDIAEFLK